MIPIASLCLAIGVVALSPTVQHLGTAPSVQTVQPGSLAKLLVSYDSTDATVSGVGVRVHYDSSQLTLDGARVLFHPGLQGNQDQFEDTAWDDGDPLTDRRYVALWSSVSSSSWPGEDAAMPLPLLELDFRAHGDHPGTTVRVTGARCGECVVEAEPVEIRIDAAAMAPTATPVAPERDATEPTPTATATPPGDDALVEPPSRSEQLPGVPAIPTLSGVGVLALALLLAAAAVAVLLRGRH